MRRGENASAAVLTHRVLPGALLPTVPLLGVELTYPEVGTALFESCAEMLPDHRFGPLTGAVTNALLTFGVDGIRETVAVFTDLEDEEFPEVAACRYAAYRLCLAHWYARATTRPMSAGEATVCLYLATDGPAAGAPPLPAPVLAEVGEMVTVEFADRRHPADPTGLYRSLLPDATRRASCWSRALYGTHRTFPLMVRPDGGGPVTYGTTPPPPPSTAPDRPVREGW
ncbi:hypothetical protein [Streptomyces sp. ST2-7A]|uniref:hypothetical protein n=1 Tax=Streptomyces sp. ST2-7A TaxID=2907214 RepID=UPI001F2EB73B|nr:hypothetical protein [Streptomyces sp. ST2-7A]MCE7081558.1 hypothetical protein [Streptomyces sp. ST2-7A]